MEQTIPETLYYSIFSINIYYIIYIYYYTIYYIYKWQGAQQSVDSQFKLTLELLWPLDQLSQDSDDWECCSPFWSKDCHITTFCSSKIQVWIWQQNCQIQSMEALLDAMIHRWTNPFVIARIPLATGCNGKYESVDVIISVIAIYPFIHTHKCRKPLN